MSNSDNENIVIPPDMPPAAQDISPTPDLGISPRAVSLGRALDRLPNGDHTIRLSKDRRTWDITIVVDGQIVRQNWRVE